MLFPRNRSEAYYKKVYDDFIVLDSFKAAVEHWADVIERHRERYRALVSGTAIPWEFPGILHCLEADCDFARQLYNGASWARSTVVWPKQTIGPWPSWEDAAWHALSGKTPGFPNFAGMQDWADWRMLCRAEQWNGTGYANRNVHSPYLLGGTNYCVNSGKFTADGQYDPKAETKDPGFAVLLKELRLCEGLRDRMQTPQKASAPAVTASAPQGKRIIVPVDIQVMEKVSDLCDELRAAMGELLEKRP